MYFIHFMKTKIRPGSGTDENSVVQFANEKGRDSAVSSPETKRDTWKWPIESVSSLVGYNVNLISVWTFPVLCMKHGGIAFMIPCLTVLFLCVFPLYFVEIFLGQRNGRGAISIYLFAPLFQGIGWASILITLLVAIYHSVYVAWSIYYLAASFTSILPWSECFQVSWKTPKCSEIPPNFTQYRIETTGNITYLYGLIHSAVLNDTAVVVNKTYPGFPEVWQLPAEEYFHNNVLKLPNSFNGDNALHYELPLCLLLGLLICILSLSKGMKSGGKVLLFMITVPYCLLLAIFVRALTTEGVANGLKQYVYPNWKKLEDYKVWGDAGLVIFFMNFISWGNVATIASYNGNKYLKCAEAFIAPLVGLIFAILIGFVISSLVGILSYNLHIPVENLLTTGSSLLFVTVAQGLTKLKLAPLWSALLYFCVLNISLSTLIVLLETIVLALANCCCKSSKRSKRLYLLVIVCLVVFLSSLGLVCKKGFFIVLLFQNYVTWWNILLLALMELGVFHVFYCRITAENNDKTQSSKLCRLSRLLSRILWAALCVGILKALIDYSCKMYIGTYYGQYKLPYGIEAIGWILTCCPLLLIIVVAFIVILTSTGSSFKEKLKSSVSMDPKWSLNDEQVEQNPGLKDGEVNIISQDPPQEVSSNSNRPITNAPYEFVVNQKIATAEYVERTGKINRASQTALDVQIQTGEGDDDDNERKRKKRKHKHRKSRKDKAPSRLPPLPDPTGEPKENLINEGTVELPENSELPQSTVEEPNENERIRSNDEDK